MEASKQKVYPSAEETVNHPAYPGTVWALKPHSGGKLAVAEGRGGPVAISWEIHGSGPTKLVLIMGLAGVKTSWQRQTMYFGHEHGDKYSVLIVDNRGMGDSDKPLGRYTTSQMAQDVVEVLDHVGWTAPRSVNVVGISMGGMIAQELALAAPERLQSLQLCCSSAGVTNQKSISETVSERIGMLVPKSAERAIHDTALQLFTEEWLAAPDAEVLPSPSEVSLCGPPPDSPSYRLFDSNYQRFQAQELTKRRDTDQFTVKGFLCQLLAAAGHSKTDEQLRAIADAVGRERILVMHGTRDNMITVNNGERLIRALEPRVGVIEQGMGHAPPMERSQWFNDMVEDMMIESGKL